MPGWLDPFLQAALSWPACLPVRSCREPPAKLPLRKRVVKGVVATYRGVRTMQRAGSQAEAGRGQAGRQAEAEGRRAGNDQRLDGWM